MPDWSRRRALATLATLPTASLAGCSVLSATQSEDGQTYTLHVDPLDGSLAEYVLWSPSQYESESDDVEAAARRAAIEDGRYTTYGFAPIAEEGEYTEYEGNYYRLSVVVTGEREMERDVLRLRWLGHAGEEGVPDPDIAIEDLPDGDTHAAQMAYFAARGREHGGDAGPDELIERGGYVYRRGRADGSVLVPESQYDTVSFHDTVLRVDPAVERLYEPAYSVVATKVADTAAEFDRVVAAAELEARVSADDLSEEQHTLVARARADTYEETTPLSAAYDGLLDALALDREDRGITRHFVRYDGEDVRCELYVNPAD